MLDFFELFNKRVILLDENKMMGIKRLLDGLKSIVMKILHRKYLLFSLICLIVNTSGSLAVIRHVLSEKTKFPHENRDACLLYWNLLAVSLTLASAILVEISSILVCYYVWKQRNVESAEVPYKCFFAWFATFFLLLITSLISRFACFPPYTVLVHILSILVGGKLTIDFYFLILQKRKGRASTRFKVVDVATIV